MFVTNEHSAGKVIMKRVNEKQAVVSDGYDEFSPHRAILPKRNNGLASRYFTEIAKYDRFQGDEDVIAAKEIAELEMTLWQVVLDNPKSVAGITRSIQRTVKRDETYEDTEEICAMLSTLRSCASRINKTKKGRNVYKELVLKLACQLYELDLNRDLIALAKNELLWSTSAENPKNNREMVTQIAEMTDAAARVEMAKHRFIQSHLSLVVAIARRQFKGQMPLLDMIQEGNLGLLKAVDRYDYRKGFKFVTYASWWIRATISRALTDKRQAIRVPANTYHAKTRLDRISQTILTQHGRLPTQSELEQESGLTQESLARIREVGSVTIHSLDQKVPNTEDYTYVELLEDKNAENPGEAALRNIWSDRVRHLLDTLTPLEKIVIYRRFGLENGREMTLKEVGESVNLSRERIRQLQNSALDKLKRQLPLSAA